MLPLAVFHSAIEEFRTQPPIAIPVPMDSTSSPPSEAIMGCHEEWPITPTRLNNSSSSSETTNGSESSSNEENQAMNQLRFEVAHTQWHNLIYRNALLSIEGGLEAAERQLNAVRQHQRPLCGECKKDELLRKLAAASKTVGSPQTPSPVLSCNPKKHKGRVKRRTIST